MPAALQYTHVVTFSSQIERYYDVFGRQRVHIIFFDDFLGDTAGQYRKTLDFLGVDADFAPDFIVSNPAKPITPRLNRYFARRPRLRRTLHALVPTPIIRSLNYALPMFIPVIPRPPRIDPDLRRRLLPLFAPEIEKVEQLVGRDLSAWKK
jgi:hypothetical protein